MTWKLLGTFQSTLQLVAFSTSSSVKPGILLVTVEHDSQAIAARSFLQEGVNPASAPKGNNIGLRDQQYGVRKIANHLHRAIHPPEPSDHDEVILVYQQVEEASQFRSGRDAVVRLLSAARR